MKKLLFAVLMAVLAIPMMQAQLDATKAGAMRSMDRSVQFKSNPMKANQWGVREKADMMRGTVLYLWDWEEDDSYEGWGAYDADGDGYSWGASTDESYSGSWCLASDSYIYGTGALDPENWLISPDINLNGTLSIWAMNYSSYFADNFVVYVCVGELTSIDDFVAISGTCTPGTSWQEFTFDLTQFQGQVGCFAICHQDSYNMYHLYIDDISIYVDEVADVPENVTVATEKVTPTTAKVTWEDNTNAAWNLRYRPVVEGTEYNLLWDFEESTDGNTNIELPGGWTSIDADGDGNDWYHLNGSTYNNHTGIGHVTSASYAGGALFPDNWLVSPMIQLDGTLKFWAAGQDPSWASEVFGVYVSTDGQNWTALEEGLVANAEMTQYTYDLTEYQGAEGYVAIRHYGVTDMFRLNVDDIEIVYVEQPEWIYVENLSETEYLIEGLTPETTYEVQVQGINPNGVESDWTESTIFTTPAEEIVVEKTATPEIEITEGINGDHTMYVEITAEEGATIEYRYYYNGEWSDWLPYDDKLGFTKDGEYLIEARAQAGNKEMSDVITDDFEITPRTAVNELNGEKAVAGVRYFNAIGQEMAQPNGMTIVVTTYTDGTTSAVKVMK